MRSAPLVTTTKLMTTRMANTIRPTAKLPPIRKWPKASITWPAAPGPVWPSSSTTRVEATFSDRRSSVVTSSTDGKAAKSSGLTICAATIITISASAMLKVNSRSSTKGGSGSTIIASTMTMKIGARQRLAAIMPALGPARRLQGHQRVHSAGQPPAGRSGSSSGGTSGTGGVGGHRRPSPAWRAQLVDPGQHLRHGGEQRGRDLLVDLGVGVQRARQRRRLQHRHLVLARQVADLQRQQVGALGHHARRGHGLLVVRKATA
jgi:hypothetical protein